MAVPEQRTKDGFEMQIGTNHLGHFALTNLLLPHVRDRVTVVASGAHRIGSIRLDDLNWERGGYHRWRAYGQSKLANLLFMSELQRRLDAAGSGIRVTGAHPGYAATNLQHRTENVVQNAIMAVGNRVWAQSEEMGACPRSTRRPRTCPATPTSAPTAWASSAGTRRSSGAAARPATRRPRGACGSAPRCSPAWPSRSARPSPDRSSHDG
jgi:NAD(P)-dependent dehydrogenase (short-subunit alcohol dehydrogenase family)